MMGICRHGYMSHGYMSPNPPDGLVRTSNLLSDRKASTKTKKSRKLLSTPVFNSKSFVQKIQIDPGPGQDSSSPLDLLLADGAPTLPQWDGGRIVGCFFWPRKHFGQTLKQPFPCKSGRDQVCCHCGLFFDQPFFAIFQVGISIK